MTKIDDIKKKRNHNFDKYDNYDPNDPDNFYEPGYSLPKIPYKKFVNGGKNFAKKIRHQKINYALYFSWKALATFIFILVFTTVVLARGVMAKNDLDKLSSQTAGHLSQAFTCMESGDLSGAMKEADQAKDNLGKIKLLAQSWGQDITYLRLASASNSKLIESERLLNASYAVLNSMSSLSSDLGKNLSKGIISAPSGETAGVPVIDLSQLENTADKLLDKIISDLEKSQADLSGIKNDLPPNLLGIKDKGASALDNALARANLVKSLFSKGFPAISGEDGSTKNILILLQNNSELRGSGGFIGSYSVATFSQGKLSKLDFQTNIYKLDNDFTSKNQITPPEDLRFTTTNGMALRDSNYAVDFSESAAKISEFYNLETGKNIDGVIAIDTTLFTDLLRVLGPIDMPNYGRTITADNFLNDVQYEVERGYFERSGNKEVNEPKAILAEMMPKFFESLMNSSQDSEKFLKIIEVFQKSLLEKHMMFYFKDKDLESMMGNLGYAGKIEPSITDYLLVHNSNLGGTKSSLSVNESLKHNVLIGADGNIAENLEITRVHGGNNDWPDGPNHNIVRVLIPQDSKLKDFKEISGDFNPACDAKNKQPSDYTVGQEAGKSKVSFWQNTEPGQTSKSSLAYDSNYHLDTSGNFSYSLFLQKQPGAISDDYELDLTYPEGFKPINVKNYDSSNRTIVLKYNLRKDTKILIKFEKEK